MQNVLIRSNEQFDQIYITQKIENWGLLIVNAPFVLLFFLFKYVPKYTGFKKFYFLVSIL